MIKLKMMKRNIVLLLILFGVSHLAFAQTTPFTGGDGSGYLSQNSPSIICNNFLGGNADGAAVALSAPTICPPFLGGDADGYSGAQKVGCNIVLATKDIKFYGEKEPHRNVLHWKVTGFEVQLFEVQKSSDGTTFIAFETIPGSTNNDITYLLIDNAPFPNVTFYRLRIIERNSLVSYSNIIPLKDFSTSTSIIYPNPSHGLSILNYYSETTQTTTLNIAQIDGKTVIHKTITLKIGKNDIPLDVQDLPNGIYFVRIGTTGKALKLIVNR
jgi:hypothetical protein